MSSNKLPIIVIFILFFIVHLIAVKYPWSGLISYLGLFTICMVGDEVNANKHK